MSRCQQKNLTKVDSLEGLYEDISEEESSDSAGSDWAKENNVRRTKRKLKNRSRDNAQGSGEIRRKLKSGKAKSKKHGLGKDESTVQTRQCYWPDCVNAARPDSKYCSDDCGVKLAKLRILTILPERIKEWKSSPSVTEAYYKKELEEAQHKRLSYRNKFDELEEKRKALDEYIEKVNKIAGNPNEEKEETATLEEGTVSCVICGHEINAKVYMRHIDRCYTKTEKCRVMESKEHSFLPGTKIFCDFYKKNEGYCKRLAVNCPNHSQRSRYPSDIICGSPLSSDDGNLNLDNACVTLKRNCNRHHNWEKIRRAEIDIQKVHAWIKHEQWQQQESRLQQQIYRLQHPGLLDMLMNSRKTESKD